VIIPSTAKFLEMAVILLGIVPVTFKPAQRTKTPTEHQLALGGRRAAGWSVG
jgi:hypothetical protein